MKLQAPNVVPVQSNHHAEIERLLSLEYGNKLEVVGRMLGVLIGSAMLFWYTNDYSAFIWSGGFLTVHFVYYRYLTTRGEAATERACHIAHALFLLVIVSFLWMPSWMFVQQDRNLSLVGASLIGCVLVYLVQRSETSLFLILSEIGVIGFIMVSLLIWVLPQVTEPMAIAGILSSWFALLVYFGQSVLVSRKRILAERAASLQAFQSQKLAAIGQLAGGVAHDFNNILTAISGNLELYEVLSETSEKDEVIAAAKSSSQRAAKVVRQLLIYARKTPVEFVLTDANQPLSDLRTLTDHLVPPNVKLTITPLKQLKFVRIDQDQLITALMNLVVNAVDAMPSGGHIDLSVKEINQTKEVPLAGGKNLRRGSYLSYVVADSGHGIPATILKSVVDPFFTTKDVGQGTGLGLSMVVTIAESAGGGLEIETSKTGTIMRLMVPYRAETPCNAHGGG